MKIPLLLKFKKPPKWLLGLVIITLLSIGGFFSYRFFVPEKSRKEQKAQTVDVKTQDLSVRISASGVVVSLQEVNLSPKNSGRLAELYVDQGDRVQAGQIIAKMQDKDVQARFAQAQANLKQVQARLAQAIAGSRPEEIDQVRSRLQQAEARLAEARAGTRPEQIDQVQAQVNAAQVQLNLARERSNRYKNLATQGAISANQLDEYLTNEQSAIANLQQAQKKLDELRNGTRSEQIQQSEAAVKEIKATLEQQLNGTRPEEIEQNQAAVEQAKAQLQAVQVDLEDTIVRAPFSGIITQKYANIGSFVTPTTAASSTSSATSTSIVAISGTPEVLAKVPERDIGQIRVGQKVEIKADAFPGKKFRGKVRLVAPAAIIEQNVTSFQVRISLEKGQDKLRSGMNVDVTFIGESIKDALVVPTVAIVTQKGKTGVLMPDANQQPEFHPVTIGSSVGDQTQILEGIKEGEKVFIYLPKVPQSGSNSGSFSPPMRFGR